MATAAKTESIQQRTCPLCEGMCGVEVRYIDDTVISVRPDKNNVISRGHICPKGTTLGDLHHSPDRVRRPLIKIDGAWKEVGWVEALKRCEALVHPVIAQYGSEVLAGRP